MLAYHDRSDGGLLLTLLEMAFATHCGLRVDLGRVDDLTAAAFAEELGAVIQVPAARIAEAQPILARHGLDALTRDLGEPTVGADVQVSANGERVYLGSRIALHRRWSEVSFRMQALRDNPECAQEEYSRLEDADDPGLHAALSYDPKTDVAAPFIQSGARPAIAMLREQGVNSHVEMAAVFTPRRIRCLRCAHDGYLGGARASVEDFTGWWHAAVFRMAMYWVRAKDGRNPFYSTRVRGKNLRLFSSAMRLSPWGSATAVKCCPRSRN